MLNLRPIGGSIPPLALVLLSLACNLLSGPAGTAPPTIPAIEATQIGATQVSMPTDTAAPQGVEVTCGGVHFWFDPSLASGATCETVAAVPDTGDAPPWDVGPEHTRITFEGYVLPGIFHMPRIYVYPVADYESMNPGAAQIIPALQAFLETKPQTFDNSIPFLPVFNAAQILRAQVQYLDFQNGTGVRFLTLYSQALRVINNDELFYTFQALTQDGAFYVAAVLPTSHPSLPADGDLPPDQFDSFVENFDSYLEATRQTLEAQAPESFTPDLALLDAMIQSLEAP